MIRCWCGNWQGFFLKIVKETWHRSCGPTSKSTELKYRNPTYSRKSNLQSPMQAQKTIFSSHASQKASASASNIRKWYRKQIAKISDSALKYQPLETLSCVLLLFLSVATRYSYPQGRLRNERSEFGNGMEMKMKRNVLDMWVNNCNVQTQS